MITKIRIKDPKNSPLYYLSDIPVFKKGAEFDFKPGVNVIVGPNGSGKTTLLNLIKIYNLVDKNGTEFSNWNMGKLFCEHKGEKKLHNGVDVYGDYVNTVFRMVHADELRQGENGMSSFLAFGSMYSQMHSSTGEGVVVALNMLFRYMYDSSTSLKFPIEKIKKEMESKSFPQPHYKLFLDYIESHKVKLEVPEYTILVDEPDRNLDIPNIKEVLSILSFHKEDTQMIAVIHNPLMICSLSRMKHVNLIEMVPGYVEQIRQVVSDALNGTFGQSEIEETEKEVADEEQHNSGIEERLKNRKYTK